MVKKVLRHQNYQFRLPHGINQGAPKFNNIIALGFKSKLIVFRLKVKNASWLILKH